MSLPIVRIVGRAPADRRSVDDDDAGPAAVHLRRILTSGELIVGRGQPAATGLHRCADDFRFAVRCAVDCDIVHEGPHQEDTPTRPCIFSDASGSGRQPCRRLRRARIHGRRADRLHGAPRTRYIRVCAIARVPCFMALTAASTRRCRVENRVAAEPRAMANCSLTWSTLRPRRRCLQNDARIVARRASSQTIFTPTS